MMSDDLGLRERKKQRTRRALVEAALRLFEVKGYEQTTVAELAAAAEVSTRTFFSYFPSKEDVLFANTRERFDIALEAVAERQPEDGVVDVLVRAVEHMMAHSVDSELTSGLGEIRLRLIMSVPALQARALYRFRCAEAELAEALHRAYPDELDRIGAATVVGVLMGAVLGAAVASLQQGDSPEQVQAAVRRATDIAVRGLQWAGNGTGALSG